MHYIRHINNRLLLQMTYKMYPFIASILFFFSACTSSPFIELNSRDNFQLEGGTKFSVSLNRDNLPVEMDPILIENLGEAVTNYLEGTGNQSSLDAPIIIELSVDSKDKIKVDDFRYYGYPIHRSYLYDTDRINSVPEFYLRISIKDVDQDKTLWTGLTKWRKGSSFAPVDMPSAELLIENLLVNL
jgi:hypothetical protein